MSQLTQLLYYFVPLLTTLYLFWYLLSSFLVLFTHLCVLSALAIIAWTGAYQIYETVNQYERIRDPEERTILITGCDTGFGNRAAERLDQYGFHVVAGVLNPDGKGVKELKEKCSPRLQVVRMDITSEKEVQSVVEHLRTVPKPLWAVVNNAGIGIFTPWDWGKDVELYQKTFDVNVFGLIRVTKAIVPFLRQSPRGGRIVNVASLAGRISINNMAAYAMSKHAVRVFSDVIRRELPESTDADKPISVTTIEPTFYKTNILDFEQINNVRLKIRSETDSEVVRAYPENYYKTIETAQSVVNMITREQKDEVVDAMLDAVTLKNEPKRYFRCCGYFDLLIWIISHGPEILIDEMLLSVCQNKLTQTIVKNGAWLISKIQ